MNATSTWPFPPGEGPFRTKGSGYLLHLQYVAEHVPGGKERFMRALEGSALVAFFEQPFFVSSWYDLMPLVDAGHTCARLTGTTFEQFVRTRSRHQFDGDLHMFRKLILRLASTSTLAARIPPTVASYLDFVESSTESQQGSRVTGALRGVPRPLSEWIRLVFEEFVHRALEVNGAANVSMRWKPSRCAAKEGIVCDDWSYLIEW
jgi:hypothetical protein